MTNEAPRVRVLLVDSRSLTRRTVAAALSDVADVEVIGTASTVGSALARIDELAPDVVVVALNSSESGPSLLTNWKSSGSQIPVIVFDVDLEPGSPRSLDARLNGAFACVSRPVDVEQLSNAVASQLVPVLRQAAKRGSARSIANSSMASVAKSPSGNCSTSQQHKPINAGSPDTGSLDAATRSTQCRDTSPASVVVIAASTGGPDALSVVLSALPIDFNIPILIVQHMPSDFTASLADRLSSQCGRKVSEGRDAAGLNESAVWIAPGGLHLQLGRHGAELRLELSDAPPQNSCRPSADVLFRSVAAIYGAHTLGVVLTGLGRDGTSGSQSIRDRNGQVIVQDQASCVAWAMPRSVAEAGIADAVVPLAHIGAEITRRCRQQRSSPAST